MRRRATFIVIVLVVLAAVGGGIYWRSQTTRSSSTPAIIGGELVTVQKGTVKIDLSAGGKVELERKAPLRFKVRGRLADIAVREGQRVTKGQKLACLETLDVEKSIYRAEAELKSAQAQLLKIKAGSRPEELAAAKASVSIAEAGVRSAQAAAQSSAANVSSATATIEGALASLNKLRAGPTQLAIQVAEKQVELARSDLWAAQAQRDATGAGGTGTPAYEGARGRVAVAESQVAISQLQLEQLKAGTRPEDVAIAQAQVSQSEAARQVAQAQLAQAQAQVDVAKAQLEQVQAQLALLQAGSRQEDVASGEARVAQAKAALEEVQLALQEVCLIAPFEALVADIEAQIGDLVESSQPIVTLVDNSLYHITVDVDEADISQIIEGQKVEILLDAYPNAKADGKIVYVSPLAKNDSGIVSYEVRLDITRCDVPLREGLTVNARIVTDLLEGRLLVPNSAITVDDETGHKYVSRRTASGDELVRIETGISNDLVSEVMSGLSEGDLVQLRSSSYRARFSEMMRKSFPGAQ